MVQKVFAALLVCVLLVLGVMWAINGGPLKAIKAAQSLANPLNMVGTGTTTGEGFQLPWQVPIPVGPELALDSGDVVDLSGTVIDEKTSNTGNPSPYANDVILRIGDTSGDTSLSEYIEIYADSGNTAPIAITGWSLQSAITGARVAIPMAAPSFISGEVNGIQPVLLNPGGTAIISSGSSPIGISFRENMCSGYLQQHQEFVPSINEACPYIELTEADASLGESCIDFARTLPQCTFPTQYPSDISAACRSRISSLASYNGCIHSHKKEQGFYTGNWRLFLGMQSKLWNRNHDVVRLLDAEGRVVSAVSY